MKKIAELLLEQAADSLTLARRKIRQLLQQTGYTAQEIDYWAIKYNQWLLLTQQALAPTRIDIHASADQLLLRLACNAEQLPPELERCGLGLALSEQQITLTIPCRTPLDDLQIEQLGDSLRERSVEELMAELKASNEALAAHQKHLEREIESQTKDIQRSEELARTIIDSAPIGVVLVDQQCRVIKWNSTATQMYGYTDSEAFGQPVKQLLKLEGDSRLEKALQGELDLQLQQQLNGMFFDLETCDKYQKTIPAEVGMTVFRLDGQCQATLFLRDISERVSAELALTESKAKAEDAVQVKSMFLANMSHEIRTPMNAIIGMAHLALKTDMSPKQRDYVSKIHSSGSLLLGIINDILDFSKIEADRMEMESINFTLDDVFKNVSTVTGQKAFEKNLELLFHIPRHIPQQLVGDPLRLGQVIINLVNNAVKFTESGEISVRVEMLAQHGDRIALKFTVSDTGIGMTKEQVGRLFTAFTQADGSTTRKYGGTGLGLSICRRLVELMGGNINVSSRHNEGSEFVFEAQFTLANEAELPEDPLIKLQSKALNNLRVLIVDDNEHALMILEEMLEVLPLRPALANSGPQALAMIQDAAATADPFNLVLMDWNMPQMSGIDTIMAMRSALSGGPLPKVVMVTAYDKDELKKASGQVDIDYTLTKPVSQSSMVDCLVDLFVDPVQETSEQSEQRDSQSDLAGLRVLLTEDNDINQQIAYELMSAQGMLVTIAGDGQQALDKLAEIEPAPYDIIFMDLQMPVMDGYEASRHIRSQSRYDHIPLIAMTAHAMVEERERCFKLGMNDHISKPINPEALMALIRSNTEGRERVGQSVALEADDTVSQQSEVDAEPCKLAQIDGLDYKNGLLRLAGNEALYEKLLLQMVKNEQDFCRRLRILFEKGQTNGAIIAAHTLKGSGANLGAVRLSDLAGRLERALEVDPTQVLGLLAELEPYMMELFSEIAAAASTKVETKKLVLEGDALGCAHCLDQLLQNFDASAIDYLDEHYDLLSGAMGGEQFEQCCRLIHDCDFDQAAQMLRQLVALYPLDLQKVQGG